MKRFLIPALLTLNSTGVMAYSNLSQQQAAQRDKQVSDVSYQLSMNLTKDAATFSGTNVLTFKLLDSSRDLVLDFDGKLVSSVTINGKKTADFTFDLEDENIILPKGLMKKGDNKVTVSYVANYTHNGAGLHQFRDPKDNSEYFYTDFETADAHRMFPHFDQPSIKAEFTLDVEAPVDWRLISNMPVAKSSQTSDRKHSYFQTTKKMSSYIMHLSAGPYAMWEDNSGKYPLRVFARKSLAEFVDADRVFDTTQRGFTFFESYYDYDYPFTKYDQLFVPEFNAGAMENAGAVTISERHLFRSPPTQSRLARRDVTIMHELAHMWFGDLVTMQWWNDLWLNESFASIMAYLGLEGIGNKNAWDRASRGKNWAYYEDQMVTTHPILADIPDILSASANFDGITYSKGSAVLRQLQYFIGEDVFRDGIRKYFKQHAFKNTTLDDFIGALESVHGKKLTGWVNTWLGTKDVNSMKLAYDVKDGKISNAKVYQSGGQQNDTIRAHANQIGLYYVQNGQLTLKDKIKVTFDKKETALPKLDGKKAPAIILPNVGDYDYIKIRLDAKSLSWLQSNMSLVKDTSTKASVWRILWDMVRDRELKADEFFAMAIKQIPHEQDVNLLRSVMRNVGDIVEDYTIDVATKNAYRRQFFDIAMAKVTTTEAGSDLQRNWYEALTFTAMTPSQIKYVTDLYDGKKTIDGIKMDNSRQWSILGILASANQKALVEERINKLAEVDSSARGHNRLLFIEASYPDKIVKEKVWESLTKTATYSLLEKRSIGGGMYNNDHPELAKPFIKRYFDEVEAIHKNGKGFEYARFFINELFPALGMEETVIAAEEFLITSEVPKTYKTLVMKSLDELKRTIAVRKKNL
jgi:aminopeptidase N